MKRFPVLALLSLVAAVSSPAQEKAAFDPSKAQMQPVGLPSPIDKFLGLDLALKEKQIPWGQIYNDISGDAQINSLKSESNICLALGVKIADGVMAIKSQDANALNRCAEQIEDLAKKLGVTKDQLARADKVRADANRGRWFHVFLELGFLQTDILKALQTEGNDQRRTLIVAAGWLQGAHYAAGVIEDHYTPELSNFLREPMLVQALIAEIETLNNETRSAPRVKKLLDGLKQLHGIVNIALDGSISESDVKKMNSLCGSLTEEFLL
jgi:hypothetical protein